MTTVRRSITRPSDHPATPYRGGMAQFSRETSALGASVRRPNRFPARIGDEAIDRMRTAPLGPDTSGRLTPHGRG
jgi:hypothetical protein